MKTLNLMLAAAILAAAPAAHAATGDGAKMLTFFNTLSAAALERAGEGTYKVMNAAGLYDESSFTVTSNFAADLAVDTFANSTHLEWLSGMISQETAKFGVVGDRLYIGYPTANSQTTVLQATERSLKYRFTRLTSVGTVVVTATFELTPLDELHAHATIKSLNQVLLEEMDWTAR